MRVTTTRTYRLHITDGEQRRGAGPRRRVMGLHYVARVERPHCAAWVRMAAPAGLGGGAAALLLLLGLVGELQRGDLVHDDSA